MTRSSYGLVGGGKPSVKLIAPWESCFMCEATMGDRFEVVAGRVYPVCAGHFDLGTRLVEHAMEAREQAMRMTERHPPLPPGKSAVRVAIPPELCFLCEATEAQKLDMVADGLYTFCRDGLAKVLRVQRAKARLGADPPGRLPA